MAGLNKVMVIGNLGADPELRYSPQGTAFANFSVATTDSWSDKNTGDKQERTEWHKIVTFGKTAENCAKYLAKGRQVYVEGKLQTTSYEKDGQTHYITKIVADVVHFLGGRQEGTGYSQPGQGGGFQQGGGYQPQRQQPPNQNMNGGYTPKTNANIHTSSDPVMQGNIPPEDDIPF